VREKEMTFKRLWENRKSKKQKRIQSNNKAMKMLL